MSEFVKYQHVERFATDEVAGIEFGTCHVFAKIDGTNASVWRDDSGTYRFGSRNRECSLDNDNQGFVAAMSGDGRLERYFEDHPEHRLYGEWLVPHSLKTYRDDAWRRFYVFDVYQGDEPLPYDMYVPWLEAAGLDYVPLLAVVKNGTYEQFIKLLESNTFLVKDGHGVGEGIVVKNYSFRNKYGRTTWAKLVRAEFKELNYRVMGAPPIKGAAMIEEKIVDDYVTTALVEKEYQKIVSDGGWKSQRIPELFGRVFHSLVSEDTWDFVNKHKNPTVNFKTLHHLTIEKVKHEKQELFT